MPNRILRDWTDSQNVDSISFEAEVFFVRLIMKVDDYGRFYGDPKMLKSYLFPLKDGVRRTDISRWIAECETAGLILSYQNGQKSFLEIQKFNQRLRAEKSKFPPPSPLDGHMPVNRRADDGQLTALVGDVRREAKVVDVDVGVDVNQKQKKNNNVKGNEVSPEQDLLDRVVEFSGEPGSRAFFQKAIRALGAGLVDEAMGEVRSRENTGSCHDRAKYLTAVLGDWMRGRMVPG